MSFLFVHGFCAACHKSIAYNPERVPSVRIDGTREAICVACHARWNIIHRTSKGLAPVAPHPDAYKPLEVS